MGLYTCLSNRSLPFSMEGTPAPLQLHISSCLSMSECHGGPRDAWIRRSFKEGPVVSAGGSAGLGQSSAFSPFRDSLSCWKCLTHAHILPTQALPFPPSLKGCHWAAIKTWPLLSKLASFVSLSQVLMIPNKFPVPQTPSPKLLSKESNLWQLSSLLWIRNKSRVSYCLDRLSGGQDDRGEKGSALNELDPLTLTGREAIRRWRMQQFLENSSPSLNVERNGDRVGGAGQQILKHF